MKNEEKANEICKRHIFDSNLYDGCMEMAEWKDEQFSIERKQLIEKANQAVTQSFENGAIFKKQQMIEKACEWLEENIHDYYTTGDGGDEFEGWFDDMFEDFKKAMEEQL